MTGPMTAGVDGTEPITEVVQVVPDLPPAIDGLGGYASRLERALREGHGISTRFVATRPGPTQPRVVRVRDRRRGGLVEALEATVPELLRDRIPLLLHYVNYAYAPRGCPWWILRDLEAWRDRHPRARLVIMFHELFASAAPWRTAFWLSPFQRSIARELCRLSDVNITSIECYASQLSSWAPSCPPRCMPVFSNVGEPGTVDPPSHRQPMLMVFGAAQTRRRAYRAVGALAAACSAFGIDTVCDVGPDMGIAPIAPPGVGLRRLGVLSDEEAERVLLSCRVGFMDYYQGMLGKSGVYAAYCVHGLVPVLARPQPQAGDGLTEGEQFVSPGSLATIRDGGDSITSAARAWYRDHAVSRHGRLFADILTVAQ